MKQAVEFYRYARDCRAMARKQKNRALETMLLSLALQWEELARAREHLLRERSASPDVKAE